MSPSSTQGQRPFEPSGERRLAGGVRGLGGSSALPTGRKNGGACGLRRLWLRLACALCSVHRSSANRRETERRAGRWLTWRPIHRTNGAKPPSSTGTGTDGSRYLVPYALRSITGTGTGCPVRVTLAQLCFVPVSVQYWIPDTGYRVQVQVLVTDTRYGYQVHAGR